MEVARNEVVAVFGDVVVAAAGKRVGFFDRGSGARLGSADAGVLS